MDARVAVLAGDGIGPEIVNAALDVLRAVEKRFGHRFECVSALIGGAAYDEFGEHCPVETLEVCRSAQAILFGSVGGPVEAQSEPKWKGCEAKSILALRKTFSFYANLRPVRVLPDLAHLSPLRPEIIADGVDILFVRELLGDIYFGAHETQRGAGKRSARDVAEYDEEQIAAVARVAFAAARGRRKKLSSVDKANVLDTSKLWREVVSEVATEFPDVALEHVLVDNCAMQLIRRPSDFDVVLTPNMFGDILSDEAAVLPGSLGLLPSASLSDSGFGLYEPSGGSAQDIAGRGTANPVGQILSLALMLRHSFKLEREACAIERSVEQVLREGSRTRDLVADSRSAVDTGEFGNRVVANLV